MREQRLSSYLLPLWGLLRMEKDRTRHHPYAGCVLEQNGKITQEPDQPACERCEDEVVIDGINVDETGLGKKLVEAGLAKEMPRIPFTHDTRENLTQFVHWIPRITLIKNHLTSWRKKRVHDGEELRSVGPVEKIHCHNVVEDPTGKRTWKVRGHQKLYFPADTRSNSGGLLERHCRNPVFSSRDLQERVREQTFAAAEL